MGLFLVAVNALVLWIASLFAPDIATVAQPPGLWLIVIAALFTLLTSVADALLGMNRPRLSPDPTTARVWRFLESLPTPRRNVMIENLRLLQIYDAIYAAALDSALSSTPVGRFRDWFGAPRPARGGLLHGIVDRGAVPAAPPAVWVRPT